MRTTQQGLLQCVASPASLNVEAQAQLRTAAGRLLVPQPVLQHAPPCCELSCGAGAAPWLRDDGRGWNAASARSTASCMRLCPSVALGLELGHRCKPAGGADCCISDAAWLGTSMGLDGCHTQLQRRWATRHTWHVALAYINALHSDCHPATCMHVLSITSRCGRRPLQAQAVDTEASVCFLSRQGHLLLAQAEVCTNPARRANSPGVMAAQLQTGRLALACCEPSIASRCKVTAAGL